jgi:hypothetical protein
MGSTNLDLGKTDGQGIFEGIKSGGARSVSPATCLKMPASISLFLRLVQGIWWVTLDEKCVSEG